MAYIYNKEKRNHKSMVSCFLSFLVVYSFFIPDVYSTNSIEINKLVPGMWYEIPDSQLIKKAYSWKTMQQPEARSFFDAIMRALRGGAVATKQQFPGSSSFDAIMRAWSGGVFDTKRNTLLIFGGGGTDYGGNEIYGFSFDRFSWNIVSMPSSYENIQKYLSNYEKTKKKDEQHYYADGNPIARNTRDFILYHPDWDSLVSIGYAVGYMYKGDYNGVEVFDLKEGNWHRNIKAAFPGRESFKCTALDKTTGGIWAYSLKETKELWEYDISVDKWIQRYGRIHSQGWDLNTIMEIDPVRRFCVVIGHGNYFVFDISSYDENGNVRLVAKESTGPQHIVNSSIPTLAYDPVSGYMLSWIGGTSIYALDLGNHEWIEIPALEKNTITPTSPSPNGTFGRWCYVPSLNVFAVVNSVNENVFVYKFYSDQKDKQAPVIERFEVPGSSSSRFVDVKIVAKDDTRIIGYQITETLVLTNNWVNKKPGKFFVDKNGDYDFWLFVKDLDGNIAKTGPVKVKVDADDLKPDIDQFEVRYQSSGLMIDVVEFKASDNKEVTGYCVTETDEQPDPFKEDLWFLNPVDQYKVSGCGHFNLCAWVKDNEGNVSNPYKAEIEIKLPHAENAILVGPRHEFKHISDAAKSANDGDTIEVDSNVYVDDIVNVRKKNIVIRGVGGIAHLKGSENINNEKGLVLQLADNLTLENLEFSGARVEDMNGAGVRNDAGDLTIRHCSFHDNENGLLVGQGQDADILIENSYFNNNGLGRPGYTHNIYIGSVNKFTIRNCLVQNAHIGHNIKTRANTNFIEYCAILEPNSKTSYSIDIPNGGDTYIIGSILHQGRNAENKNFISYKQIKDLKWNQGRNIYLINNTIFNDEDQGIADIVNSGSDTQSVVFLNNAVFDRHKNISLVPKNDKAPIIINTIIFTEDPGFFDYKKLDFSLTDKAQDLINKGSSQKGKQLNAFLPACQYKSWHKSHSRPISGQIDIGAYEYSEALPVLQPFEN